MTAPRMIFDDLGDMLTQMLKVQSAESIAALLNRERKAVYALRDGCGFHCDVNFICGLRALGYDLKLEKLSGGASENTGNAPTSKASIIFDLLSALKEDMVLSQDIADMRATFENITDDLCQVTSTFELLLPCLRDTAGNDSSRDALTFLFNQLLRLRENMVKACFNTSAWNAADTAQTRVAALEAKLSHRMKDYIKAAESA